MNAEPSKKNSFRLAGNAQGLPRARSVLLLVDFINTLQFEGAEDLAPGALQAARATAQLKRRLQGIPAIYANDNYGQWRSEFGELCAACCKLPREAGQIARLLAPRKADLAILKPRHSAFLGTPLELLLAQMHTQRIILVGLAADICVQLTAMDAHLRGYRLWIPGDCTAAEDPGNKEASLEYMRRVLKADIRNAGA